MRLKATALPAAILFAACVLSAGVFVTRTLLAHKAPVAVEWSQNTGSGTVFPACGSASSQSTMCAADGTAQDTVTWDITGLDSTPGSGIQTSACQAADLTFNGQTIEVGCSGSYTFSGLNSNQSYSCRVIGWHYYWGTLRGYSTVGYDCSFTTPDCGSGGPTCSMSATPSDIAPGQSARLAWNSSGADSATVTRFGSVQPNGAGRVSPPSTFTYTGTFSGPGGSTQCSATVTVGSSSNPPSPGPLPPPPPSPPKTCPNNSLAPNNDPAQCTCAQGNSAACIASCPDGSAPPTPGDTSSCTCAQENQAACVNNPPGSGYCTSPYNCVPPSPPGPGCSMAVAPSAASPGQSVVLGWASACDGASAGCTRKIQPWLPAIPVVADNTSIDQGVGPKAPGTYGNPITVTPFTLPTTYTLSGNLVYNIWPFLPVSGSDYSCNVTVGAAAANRNNNACTPTSATCSADGSSVVQKFAEPACTANTTQCPYWATSHKYGCVQPGGGAAFCNMPPRPTATFKVSPTLVKSGSVSTLSWTVGHETVCSISGTDGESWPSLTEGISSATSKPIVGQTIFTMDCQEDITKEVMPKQMFTVSLTPLFQEK